MRTTIENWQGTDAELLAELNDPKYKRVIGTGMVTLAMVGDVSVELAAGLNYTLEQVIAMMPTTNDAERAQVSLLKRFADRLTISDLGLDLSNDTVRSQMSAILQSAGWVSQQIDPILALGAVYESEAKRSLGRSATQQDVDDIRVLVKTQDLQKRVDRLADLLRGSVSGAMTAEQLETLVITKWNEAE